MTTDDCEKPKSESQLDEFPETGLDWARDDDHEPSQLTIFDPEGPNIATAWLTADADSAVSLDQIQ